MSGMYEIQHDRDHIFDRGGRKGARKKGEKCDRCGRVHSNIAHHGYPPSMNLGGAGINGFVFDNYKQAWQASFKKLMTEAEVPKELEGVSAEGLICFPDRTPRDQGNFKWLLEKALGDALKDGWIPDDQFYPVVQYEFGGLTAKYIKGEAWTRIMLFTR